MSRGTREPYQPSPQWSAVSRVTVDRDAEDAAGTFGDAGGGPAPGRRDRPGVLHGGLGAAARGRAAAVASAAGALRDDLGARPGAAGAGHRGRAAYRVRRVRDRQGRDRGAAAPGDAGGRGAVDRAAPRAHQRAGLAGHHPGRQPGPGEPGRRWPPASRCALPDHGLGVLHHVHADDVAQAFERALSRPAAIGASFHVVAATAMTLRGLAAGVAGWFGREPKLDLVDWAEFERRVGAGHAATTREHTVPQHHGEHRPGPGDPRLRAPLHRAGRPARSAGLAGGPRPGRRRRPAVLTLMGWSGGSGPPLAGGRVFPPCLRYVRVNYVTGGYMSGR